MAKVICWIGIIASVIGGLGANVLLGNKLLSLLMFILIAGLGSLISWISSFFMYGFGQLIENSDTLVEQGKKSKTTNSNVTNQKDIIQQKENVDKAINDAWQCDGCGKSNLSTTNTCSNCGKTRD